MKTIREIIPAVIFGLLLFSNALASEAVNPVNEYDSIYKYNALENKISFRNTTGSKNNLAENLSGSADAKLSDAIVTNLQDATQKQKDAIEKSENAMNDVESRNGLKTFMLGNNLGILKFQLVQIESQASLLKALALKSEYRLYLPQLNNQFKALNEKQKKVEDFILLHESKFSLFGWLVNSL